MINTYKYAINYISCINKNKLQSFSIMYIIDREQYINVVYFHSFFQQKYKISNHKCRTYYDASTKTDKFYNNVLSGHMNTFYIHSVLHRKIQNL